MNSFQSNLISSAFEICKSLLRDRGLLGEYVTVTGDEGFFLGRRMCDAMLDIIEDSVVEEHTILYQSGDLEDDDTTEKENVNQSLDGSFNIEEGMRNFYSR